MLLCSQENFFSCEGKNTSISPILVYKNAGLHLTNNGIKGLYLRQRMKVKKEKDMDVSKLQNQTLEIEN